MKSRHFVMLLASAFLVGACERPEVSASAGRPTSATSVSLQDLMSALVDPAADALWGAVSIEITKDGPVAQHPESDEAWKELRKQAVTLVESANALRLHRPVVAAGGNVEDTHVPGVYSADEVARAIDADWAGFNAEIAVFQRSTEALLVAVGNRNPAALLETGEKVQEACESCHARFWYPNAAKAPVK